MQQPKKDEDDIESAAGEVMITLGKFMRDFPQMNCAERKSALLTLRAQVDVFRRKLFQEVPSNGNVLIVDFKKQGNAG